MSVPIKCNNCARLLKEQFEAWEIKAKEKFVEEKKNCLGCRDDFNRKITFENCSKCGKESIKTNNEGDKSSCANNKCQSDKPNNREAVNLLDQLEQYFIQNNIKLIKRENGKLVVEFNDENNINNLTTEQQEKVSKYLIQTNRQSLSLQEIRAEKEREQNPTNWTSWMVGGGILLSVIAIGAIIFIRNKNKKDE